QFENARLCLRLHTASERKALRQRTIDTCATLGLLPAIGENSRPGQFEAAPPRLSSVMTVAYRDGLLADFPERFDWTRFSAEVEKAGEAVRKVAALVCP